MRSLRVVRWTKWVAAISLALTSISCTVGVRVQSVHEELLTLQLAEEACGDSETVRNHPSLIASVTRDLRTCREDGVRPRQWAIALTWYLEEQQRRSSRIYERLIQDASLRDFIADLLDSTRAQIPELNRHTCLKSESAELDRAYAQADATLRELFGGMEAASAHYLGSQNSYRYPTL